MRRARGRVALEEAPCLHGQEPRLHEMQETARTAAVLSQRVVALQNALGAVGVQAADRSRKPQQTAYCFVMPAKAGTQAVPLAACRLKCSESRLVTIQRHSLRPAWGPPGLPLARE